MKKLILSIFLMAVAVQAYAWKPLMAGHRGSNLGVANTAEAYRNGVDVYGYQGLECDVRVTSDGHYVICHDETTNSLGGNLNVATATLEQLKAETLTQTRNGIEYTGKICTVAEYLDICKEKNAFPIIELKWTTGINNNDMSKFPGLMKLVDERNMRSTAIFLTSMQKSLEYIRTNYPDATCQYLISNPNDDRFNWCVKWNVNPSIQSGKFEKDLVVRYHQKGLQVAMWTVNSESNYNKYGKWGVYMMTCDYLPAKDMPELPEVDWDAIPQVKDPIQLDVTVLWERSLVKDNLPINFPSKSGEIYKTGQQAAIVDGVFYVNDYGTKTLLVMDQNSTEVKAIPASDELSGSPAMGITSDDAGNIIQRYEDGISVNPSKIRIFKKGEKTGKIINFTLPNNGQANFAYASGDVFSAEGGYLYVYPNRQSEVYTIQIKNGELGSITSVANLSIAASTAGVILPIDNNPKNFIYQVRNYGFYLVNGTDKGDYLTGSGNTTAPNRNTSLGGAFLRIDGHDILVHPSGTNYNGGFSIKDMSASAKNLATIEPLGKLGYTANSSTGSFMKAVKEDENTYTLYVYAMGAGYGAYRISKKGAGVENITAQNNAKLYPTVVNDIATLSSDNPINDIQIFNLSGAMVFSTKGNNENVQTLNLGELPQGTYILRLNQNESIKLIKK